SSRFCALNIGSQLSSVGASRLAAQLALELWNDQGNGHKYGGDQIQILCFEADEIAVQCSSNKEAVDDGTNYDSQRGPDDFARRQDGLTHDHCCQTNHDGADAHGDVRATLGLHKHGARQAYQTVRDGHAQQNHATCIDAL